MSKHLLFILILVLASCNEQKSSLTNGVYFAGEIVNPTSDYVVLYRKDKVVDSAKLNEENQFAFELKNIEEGLHHFDHAPELQYVYFEKGDSLLVRLNTAAFDESLVFSGTSGDVNNFLIEMFLNHEDEEHFVYSLYKLHPKEFEYKIDSLHQQKINELSNLTENRDLSENALAMAKASIDYTSFLYKEKYPFYHKKYTGEDTFHKLGAGFYKHREVKPVNYEELVYFRPYYDYMIYHFGNLSYMACADECGGFNQTKQAYLHLNKHKLQLVDSIVKNQELRNNLFRNIVVDVLLREHMANSECDSFIEKFKSLSTNETHHEEINHLYSGIKNLQPNKLIPELTLTSFNDDQISLKEIAKSNHTVFYFWSGGQKKHFKNVTKHIEKLKKEHPKKQFVGICVMTSKEQWSSILNENGLAKENQYWAVDMDEVRNKLVVSGLNKCLIVNDTLIENGFANLYTSL